MVDPTSLGGRMTYQDTQGFIFIATNLKFFNEGHLQRWLRQAGSACERASLAQRIP